MSWKYNDYKNSQENAEEELRLVHKQQMESARFLGRSKCASLKRAQCLKQEMILP